MTSDRTPQQALSPAPPLAVLDQHMVGALRALGRKPGRLLEEMVHGFLIEAPALTADIERAVERGSHLDAAQAGHRLRGMSAHLGLARLAAAAGEVEAEALAGWRATGRRRGSSCAPWVVAVDGLRTELEFAIAAARDLAPWHLSEEPPAVAGPTRA